MIRKYRTGILGCVAGLIAATLAYLGTPLSYAGLAAEFVALTTVVVHRQGRISGRIEAGLRQQARLEKRLDDRRRESKRNDDRTAKKLVELRKAIDVVVDRSDKRQSLALQRELGLLAATIRDQEIESGLAALNRYTSLASGQEVAPESVTTDPTA